MSDKGPQTSSLSPASVYESPEFHSFSVKITIIGLPLIVIGSYLASYLLIFTGDNLELAATLSIGPMSNRIADLSAVNLDSKYSYIGTLIFCMPASLVVAYLMTRTYFHSVVRAGLAKKMGQRGDYGIFLIAAILFLIIWFTFFMDLSFPQGRRLGMGRIFLWPIFPFFGALASFSAACLFFAIPAGIYKIKAKI